MVSIITPSFNAAAYIANTIESVLAQTYQDWELIIVDDASTDNTCEIVASFVDKRIRLFTQYENCGAGVARSLAIEYSSGDYIAFLDADDLWHPYKLTKQVALMQETNAVMSYTAYEMIDELGQSLHKRVNVLPSLTYDKLLKANYVGNLTGMYSVKRLGKLEIPNIRKRQDWGFWLKTLENDEVAIGIPVVLAYYRVHKAGLSGNKMNLIKHNFNFYRKALNFGFFKASIYFVRFIYEHFFVKSKLIKSTK